MLIMQVYHDSSRMRDFGRMPDSGKKIWLQSPFLTPIDVITSDVSPDSSRASRLWSISAPPVLPPQLWKTLHDRVRWLYHLIVRTLSWKQTGRDTWLSMFKTSDCIASHAGVVRPWAAWPKSTYLGVIWDKLKYSEGLDTQQPCRINVFECLVRRA
jgi:hypothetical protein